MKYHPHGEGDSAPRPSLNFFAHLLREFGEIHCGHPKLFEYRRCRIDRIAPYPMKRISFSLPIIFGVVPVPMMAWKPDKAPHAMVIKTKGKTLPGMTGPQPLTYLVIAAIWNSGCTMHIPDASSTMVPTLRYVERQSLGQRRS